MEPLNVVESPEITWIEARRLIAQSKGRFFRAVFRKRGDGTVRDMIARLPIKPDPYAGRPAYDPTAHGLIWVWEPFPPSLKGHEKRRNDCFRSIPIEGLIALKIRGRRYRVVSPVHG